MAVSCLLFFGGGWAARPNPPKWGASGGLTPNGPSSGQCASLGGLFPTVSAGLKRRYNGEAPDDCKSVVTAYAESSVP